MNRWGDIMFVDEVSIKLIAGKGGDGCTSFRREKYIPMGGPDGGSGGRGGNIVFVADASLNTLVDLKFHKIVKAEKGENGKGKNKTGAHAEDVILRVPVGTTITDEDTGLVLADLIEDGDSVIGATGGRGGRGNVAFATKEQPAPKLSELGEPGEIRYVKCELKVLADVGLVGMPSVGKSSFLGAVSGADPKVAAYHFTTLSPNLGVVDLGNNKTFVIADLPGMIEGASKGVGLGLSFLRHASRTRILAHVIDMAGSEGRDPISDYEIIRKEIVSYSDALANKKEIIVANKSDMEGFKENLEKFKNKYPDKEIYSISALNKEGLSELLNHLYEVLESTPKSELYNPDDYESTVVYRFKNEQPYTITHEDGVWVLRGKEIEHLFAMTRFEEDEAVQRFGRKLKGMGIEDALERLGAKRGDEVQIDNYIFEWKE